MPVSSHQISQLISAQQASFGNVASYAQQISPMGRAMGVTPTYSSPYAPMASPGAADYNTGAAAAPGILNAAASFGAPMMMGAGMMMGGRAGAMLDPFTAGMRGFGRGAGWQGGAGIATNLGNMARGGIGGLARGVGMAGLAAAPVMGMYSAGKYALGQMAEGAQFQNQVNSSLQNNFRFSNDQSRTGYGFSQTEQKQIGGMIQSMGTKDMMTTPKELLSIVNQGSQMGLFRGVQDAKEFKQRFSQMKDSLKEIASTFNTTLSEALPFFQEARKQGFWTPQDVTRHATQVRQVQANTGMSANQAQQVMSMGAQMTRSMGGTGQQGSEMMGRAQMMSGSAVFGGVVNEKELANAGFGTGAAGTQNLGNMLAGATARFSRSRVGRWALAGLMNKEGTGLDEDGLGRLTSGTMNIGEIGRRARGNVSGKRAYDFKMNEGELRGQLAQQGPEAALGIVKSLAGGRLHGDSGRDKLVTRRIIQKFMGGNARQADIVAKMARDMPKMLAVQAARSEGSMDSQERQRSQMMNDTYEGFKRKLGHWWEEKIDAPLKEAGSEFSYRVGRSWQRFQDKLFGTGGRSVGLSAEAVRSMVRSADTGNYSYVDEAMGGGGGGGLMGGMGGGGGSMGLSGNALMGRMGFEGKRNWGKTALTAMTFGAFGSGDMESFSSGDIREMGALSRASRGVTGDEEASAVGYGSAREMRTAMGGAGSKQIQEYMKSAEVLGLRGSMGKDLDDVGNEDYASALITRIKSGRAGEAAQRMFEGVSGRQAMGRLGAAQGKARGGFTGVASLGQGTDFSGQDARERVEENQEEAVEGLATLLRGGSQDTWFSQFTKGGIAAGEVGGITGVAVTEHSIEELKKDSRGARAMSLFSQARDAASSGNDEKAASLKEKARGLMSEIGNDKNTSAAMRSAAISISKKDHPQANAIADMVGRVGTSVRRGDRLAFSQKIKGRRDRFREKMGSEGMENLMKLAGGDESTLGKTFSEAMSTKGSGEEGGVTGRDYTARMLALARAAAEDPDEANRMLTEMKREGLDSTDLGVLLSEARKAQSTAKKMGLSEDLGEDDKITSKARRGVSRRLKQLGLKGSGKEVGELIRGGDSARLRKKLEDYGYKTGDVSKLFGTMKGGMTRSEMVEADVRTAAKRGITTLDEKVAKRAGLDPSEMSGIFDKGDSAQLQQLKVHTKYFEKIHDVLLKTNRQEKVPKKNKDGK